MLPMYLEIIIYLLKTLVLFVDEHLRNMRKSWTVTIRKQRYRFKIANLRIKLIESSYCLTQESEG